jgi:hypothetical protein
LGAQKLAPVENSEQKPKHESLGAFFQNYWKMWGKIHKIGRRDFNSVLLLKSILTPLGSHESLLRFYLKDRLHSGIAHETSHGISHGTQFVPQKDRGTFRVICGLSVGLTEYYMISHEMSHRIFHRVNEP